jgi:hypothetical protein
MRAANAMDGGMAAHSLFIYTGGGRGTKEGDAPAPRVTR